MTLFLAFLIGVIAGLRALTAPAVVAWAAHRNWLNLYNSPFSFMGSTAAIIVFTLLALVELVADQLPSAPRGTEPPGLIARMLLGGLSGAAVTKPRAAPSALDCDPDAAARSPDQVEQFPRIERRRSFTPTCREGLEKRIGRSAEFANSLVKSARCAK
jgi:hypothetical protein